MRETDRHRIAELQAEVDQSKEAMASPAVVDQAIGVVMLPGRLSPYEGCEIFEGVSQHTDIKLRDIADLILGKDRCGDIPPDVRAALEDALDRHGPVQVPGAAKPAPGPSDAD